MHLKAPWLPLNGHELSRSTAANPDVFDLGKDRTTTPELRALLLTNSVWVL